MKWWTLGRFYDHIPDCFRSFHGYSSFELELPAVRCAICDIIFNIATSEILLIFMTLMKEPVAGRLGWTLYYQGSRCLMRFWFDFIFHICNWFACLTVFGWTPKVRRWPIYQWDVVGSNPTYSINLFLSCACSQSLYSANSAKQVPAFCSRRPPHRTLT